MLIYTYNNLLFGEIEETRQCMGTTYTISPLKCWQKSAFRSLVKLARWEAQAWSWTCAS